MKTYSIYKYLVLIFLILISGEFVALKNIVAQNKFALNEAVLGEKTLNIDTEFTGNFYEELRPLTLENLPLEAVIKQPAEKEAEITYEEKEANQKLIITEGKIQEIVDFLDQGTPKKVDSQQKSPDNPNRIQQIILKNEKIYQKIINILD